MGVGEKRQAGAGTVEAGAMAERTRHGRADNRCQQRRASDDPVHTHGRRHIQPMRDNDGPARALPAATWHVTPNTLTDLSSLHTWLQSQTRLPVEQHPERRPLWPTRHRLGLINNMRATHTGDEDATRPTHEMCNITGLRGARDAVRLPLNVRLQL